jgi:hypothetical protein
MWPAHRVDNSGLLVVSNIKVRMKAQHSIPSLSLHDLIKKSFAFSMLQTFVVLGLKMVHRAAEALS